MNSSNYPTLLELTGAISPIFDKSKCALLLIDFQKEYTEGKLALGKAGKKAIETAQKLLSFSRKINIPVYHIVQHGKKDGAIFNPESYLSDIVDELKPLQNEVIIIKKLPSSFDNTHLHQILSERNITQLIVAGLMTHMCVSSTIRAGLVFGYKMFLCPDACATRNLKLGSNIIKAEILHDCSIAALSDRFATIMYSSEIMI